VGARTGFENKALRETGGCVEVEEREVERERKSEGERWETGGMERGKGREVRILLQLIH
jgi:hypothetical protein